MLVEYLFFGLVVPVLLWVLIIWGRTFKQSLLFLACYAATCYFLNITGSLSLYLALPSAMIVFVILKTFVLKNFLFEDIDIRFDKKKLFLISLIVLVSLSGFDFQRYWAEGNYLIVRQTHIDAKVPELSSGRSTTLDSKLLWFLGENAFDAFGFENKPALILINYFFFIGFLLFLFHWLEETKINPVFALPFIVFWQELIFLFGAFQPEALIAFFALLCAYAIVKRDDLLVILSFLLGLMSKRIFVMLFPIVLTYLALKNRVWAAILVLLTVLAALLVQGIFLSLITPFPEGISIEKIPIALIFVLINAVPALFYFYAKARQTSIPNIKKTFETISANSIQTIWQETKTALESPDKKIFIICSFAIIAFTVFELKYFVQAWYLQRYLTLFSGIFIFAAAKEAQKKPSLFLEFFFLWGASKMFLLGKEILLY